MRRPLNCVIHQILVVSLIWGTSIGSVADEPKEKKVKSAPAFDQLKNLSGEWSGKASHGEQQFDATVSYRVTSAGSAVIETLAPGTGHEMITMYHLHDGDLLLTHYCAAGNQPRMKAVRTDNPRKLEFKFLDGTNLDAARDMHMHDLTLEFVDDDHLRAEWVTFQGGKPMPHTSLFDLRRKQKDSDPPPDKAAR